MATFNRYTDEKLPEIEVLPAPATSTPQPKRRSLVSRVFKCAIIVVGALLLLNVLHNVGHSIRAASRRCHRVKHQMPFDHHMPPVSADDDGPQHPFPPTDDWLPFNGPTHFEFEPSEVKGLSIRGTNTFGKVTFTTTKFSNHITVDLDIKTNKKDKNHDVSVEEDEGRITINTPTGATKLETYTAATIQIPSNIFGHFSVPSFSLDVPQHMVDFSALPASLEIGAFKIRVAKGFVKTGPLHTNVTQLSIAHGALQGSVTHARDETNVDVAKGNVSLDVSGITSGNQGVTKIHLGNGYFNSTGLAVYNSTSIDVAAGGIYIAVDFKSSGSPRAELSTRIASGDSRVFVGSIAADRVFESSHVSVNGDQLITYPSNFQGTVDARGIVGNIKLEGKDLDVEKVVGGLVGRQGDSERNTISVKTVKGQLDILVGDEE